MRILIIGATGTLGRAVTALFADHHEVLRAGRNSGELKVDAKDPSSVQAMFEQAGPLDAVVMTAGGVHVGPLGEMTPAQVQLGLGDKLMGQVNVVLAGQRYLRDGGSFTLTSGIVAQQPIRQGVAMMTTNRAIEGFVQSAACELPRGQRINVVSPSVLTESWEGYGPYFAGFEPVSAARAALAYQRSVEGVENGQIYRVW
ncbi:short chain dehydrogenase [Dyella sp. GSA-30]|uniref:short chain dehydrogenase n=1 Tax=Dyella sp. GSA-30 TaxID=2994496 RepID=UPI002491F562|nr:short chain dehydrogenase [Dyella sp. GSA-30]BDU20111.1 short chain dehydrogenase [Dyella sp. GSA-30]